MQEMYLAGKFFEGYKYHKTDDTGRLCNLGRFNDYSQIYVMYKKPSRAKVRIWEEWVTWARAKNVYLYISSANCHMFTIKGYIVDKDGCIIAEVWITKDHNKLYLYE